MITALHVLFCKCFQRHRRHLICHKSHCGWESRNPRAIQKIRLQLLYPWYLSEIQKEKNGFSAQNEIQISSQMLVSYKLYNVSLYSPSPFRKEWSYWTVQLDNVHRKDIPANTELEFEGHSFHHSSDKGIQREGYSFSWTSLKSKSCSNLETEKSFNVIERSEKQTDKS